MSARRPSGAVLGIGGIGSGLTFALNGDHTLGREWFPRVGTHFLWHIFGGLATFCLVRYLLASEERDAAHRDDREACTDAKADSAGEITESAASAPCRWDRR